MRNIAIWLLLSLGIGRWLYQYKGWTGIGILAVLVCLGYLLYSFKPLIARMRERSRERARLQRFAARQPCIDYDETETELLKRLAITKRKGQEIGWDFIRWSSYPAFRRPHLNEFPGVSLEFGDREHLAQIYFYKRK